MLTVYATNWCPHCKLTVNYLMKNGIDFVYKDIEKQPDDVVQKVIAVNGGKDWVVPTLEFNGKWRPGKKFHSRKIQSDLEKMGVI